MNPSHVNTVRIMYGEQWQQQQQQQDALPYYFRSLAVSEGKESPLGDVSNRQYLTPRWRERSSSSGSVDIPLPSLDYEDTPIQPRHIDFVDYVFVTPPGRQGQSNRTGNGPLPYLPIEVGDNDSNTISPVPTVRLAPRYDRNVRLTF